MGLGTGGARRTRSGEQLSPRRVWVARSSGVGGGEQSWRLGTGLFGGTRFSAVEGVGPDWQTDREGEGERWLLGRVPWALLPLGLGNGGGLGAGQQAESER